MLRKIDFIFVIEHHRRELSFVKEISRELQIRGYSIYIVSEYFSIWKLVFYKNAVVLLPHCISLDSNILSCISSRRGYQIVNMNWEQSLSPVSKSVKILRDDARNFYQMGWNSDFKDFLLQDCGVSSEKIVRSLNPTKYLLTNSTKSTIFERYLAKINLHKYIFVPLNYNWAMMSSKRRSKRIQNLGYDLDEALEYIKFSVLHQEKFFEFLRSLIKKDNRVIVIRPHPSITVKAYIRKMRLNEELNRAIKSGRVIITDDHNAIDWINYAEVTISNWSTLVYDAYEAGKKAGYFWPCELPAIIDAEHTLTPPKFSNIDQFYTLKNKSPKNLTVTEFHALLEGLIEIIKYDGDHGIRWKLSIKRVFVSYFRNCLIIFGFGRLIPSRLRIDYFKPITYKKSSL